jgi:DNA polymerase-3 subunit epsilon
MIRERHPDGRFEEAHVFDRWCHLGTARSEDELAELASARAEIDFDPDIYKIVQAFVAKHPRRIRPLPSIELEEALLP